MSALRVYVEGVGLWSPQLAGFASLRQLLAGHAPPPPPPRPEAAMLPPNERRRAPESVRLAVEVASQAVAMSGRDGSTLACVFASSHGDQAITDYMCASLARAAAELSPIRFHNSVHNAPVGYWTIANGCHAPSTAVASQRASFGAGLLEAATQVLAGQCPVLLVCSDTEGYGPLREVTGCNQSFGCALLLAPGAGPATLARLELQLGPAPATSALDEPLAGWSAANPAAASLPLLALLASADGRCHIAAGASLGLQLDLTGIDPLESVA